MGRPRIKTIESALETEKTQKTEVSDAVEENLTDEKDEQKAKTPISKLKRKSKKAKVRGKKFQESVKLVDKTKFYPLEEAISLLKKTNFTKFDATVEAHFNLGIDPTKTEQKIRGVASLPHGSGKKVKLLVFGLEKSHKSEWIEIGDESTISEIEKGKADFDRIIVTPDWMSKLAKLAKVLGPKGLMPNPRSGTVTEKPLEVIKEIQGGSVEFKSENQPVIHSYFGKASWEENKLKENLEVLYKAIVAAKPAAVKKSYIVSAYLSATMSPAIKVDLSTISTQ